MKNILFKSAFILLLSFVFVQSSEAHGRWGCRHHCYGERFYGPRYYARPQIYSYGPAWIPGHFYINRWDRRVWVSGHYR